MKNMIQVLDAVFTGIAAVVAIVAVASAYEIGKKQNEISDRLLRLQDYVAIAVSPQNNAIALWNTGKANLYMWGFDMPNNNQRFDKPRLISTSEVANYWIPIPDLGKVSTTTNFEFRLYLTDEYNNKWVSENGGEVSPMKPEKDGDEIPGAVIKVWSYKTYKNDWQLK